MEILDPARTALLVVHMAKGVAGQVDTPFNRLFRQRAEETGVIGVQARLLDGFRKAKAKVVYTLVTYQPGLPGVRPNSPMFRTLVGSPTLLQGTPAVEVIDDIAPRPDEPVVRGQAANGFDGTTLDTILRVAGIDTLVLVGIATDVGVESTARALHATGNTGRSSSPTPARPTATRPTPARSTSCKSGSARPLPQTRSSAL
ncbi:Nicotinamidase-related amidase [Bradyrhizobium erythrophlei]|uniref:Nicotinamidase-related amidase n=1 Tax=Bradyrhizobium erythrophlei TaxID=1437360 RepID=A0A1M7U4D9_9BRAD|nr:isochorismatase family cysteine hydrolase [Bradyrhizobium erythrophlei]SHN77740.1 Nicotinamidase-related amidase [Bradyrhizobium erythrophlei]